MTKHEKSRFSWVQFIIATPVAFALAYVLLPLSQLSLFETAELRGAASGAIGLLFGLIAARYGDDAWHAAGSIW